MKNLILGMGLAVGLAATGCSSFGPTPTVNVIKKEVSKTKKVEGILFANPSGLRPDSGPANAYQVGGAGTYLPPTGMPMKALSAVLTPLGVPSDTANSLFAGYQVEFMKVAHAHIEQLKQKKKPKAPVKLNLPQATAGVPKSVGAAKKLVANFKSSGKASTELVNAIGGHDPQKAMQALQANKDFVGNLTSLSNYLFDKAGVTYLALGYVSGSSKEYNAKKPLYMAVGLVNVKTGQLRYFATIDGTKGAIPTPWAAQIGLLSNNLFSAADEKAPLPEEK